MEFCAWTLVVTTAKVPVTARGTGQAVSEMSRLRPRAATTRVWRNHSFDQCLKFVPQRIADSPPLPPWTPQEVYAQRWMILQTPITVDTTARYHSSELRMKSDRVSRATPKD
eukprot:5230960-Pleurochrysis_carterae.AAC.6